ncbi:hypothetical protein ABIA31_006497 [Catenulispora sp. MAP5-51]|uniref:DUF7144 family membrane protein n=1 Tax=Catenulispora sp. MAP5-51 TaxID=3156298 RepID=UPI0035133B29
MAAQVSANHDPRPQAPGSPWASGGMLFAGLIMVINGVFSILLGMMALAHNSIYHHVPNYYFRFSLTAWGWIELVIGILLAATGIAVLAKAAWGRPAAILVASIAMFMGLLIVPYYPVWAVAQLILDFFVIGALVLAD